jgi:hypothetical protein
VAADPTAKPRRGRLIGAWRGPSVARATYGLIVVMSVLAVWSEEHDPDGSEVLESLVATAVIFWLAHVYAAITEATMERKRRMSRPEVRDLIAHEWPLVEVAIVPSLVMALSVIGVLETQTAITIALYACLGELALTGTVAAWRTGLRGWRFALFAGSSVALGLAVVGLKTLLH